MNKGHVTTRKCLDIIAVVLNGAMIPCSVFGCFQVFGYAVLRAERKSHKKLLRISLMVFGVIT